MAEESTSLPVKTAEKEAERAPVHRGWPPMESIRRDLNRLFEDFGDLRRSPLRQGLLGAEPLWSRELTWAAMPAVDVAEKDKAYEITAELPGMDDKYIEVKVANGMLTIRGEKKEEKEEKKGRYFRSERAYGAFYRIVPLPEGALAETAKANFKDGVLEVTVPLAPAAKKGTRRIDIAG